MKDVVQIGRLMQGNEAIVEGALAAGTTINARSKSPGIAAIDG